MAAGMRDIKIRFTGDSSGIEKASQRSLSGLEKFERGARKVSKFAAGAFAGLAVGLGAMVKKTADAGDEIIKTAPKLGVTTDALQEMRHWANLNGLSQESLDRAVGRLNQRIGLAADGNDTYADAFKNLGVRVKGANGEVRDTNGVMAETIAKLSAIEDPMTRSAKASEIFGTKMARDLMPALEGGAMSLEDAGKQAHELGLVMDNEALQSSAKFQDALARLEAVGTGLIANFIIPFLNVMVDDVFPFIENNIVPAVKRFSQALTGNEGTLLKATAAVFGVLAALAALHPVIVGLKVLRSITMAVWAFNAALLANPIGLVVAAIVALIAILVVAWKKSDTFRKIVTTAFNWVKNAASTAFNWIKRNWPLLLGIITGPIGWAVTAVVRNWDHIKSAVSRAVTGIKGFLSGMWDGMVSGAKAAVNAAIGVINGAVGGINTLIDGANFLPGVSIPHVPSIPYLAEGGVVTRPTLAMIGEGGEDEAVMPLSKLRDMLDEVGGGGVIENHIHIGDEVVRVTRSEIKGHDRGLRRRAAMAGGAA